MADASPDRATCQKAIKLLEQFGRLARKYGIKISAARLQRLNELRDAGTITSADLPGKLAKEMPGEFVGLSLDEIRERCGM
jgi:hypothetical protein